MRAMTELKDQSHMQHKYKIEFLFQGPSPFVICTITAPQPGFPNGKPCTINFGSLSWDKLTKPMLITTF